MFGDKEFNLDSRFNLIIGKNGSGKTTILKAIRIALGDLSAAFQTEMPQLKPMRIDLQQDVQRDHTGAPVSTKDDPTRVESSFTHDIDGTNKSIYTEIKLNEKKSSSKAHDLREYALGAVENGILPLALFFSTGRLKDPANLEKDKPGSFYNYQHRGYRGYLRALDNNVEIQNVLPWVSDLFTNGTGEGEQLKALKTAFRICFPTWKDIGWNKEFAKKKDVGEFCVWTNDGNLLLYSWLSDGQQTIVNIIVETLYRCSKLNPKLFGTIVKGSEDVFTLTPGILLIDELDMHLHPEWQQKIVQNFKDILPNIQIIATSHAPLVIQSCETNEILDLEQNDKIEKLSRAVSNDSINNSQKSINERESPKNLSASYVLKDWQGVNPRSEDFEYKVSEMMNFYELVDVARSTLDEEILLELAGQARLHLDLVTDKALLVDMRLYLKGVPKLNKLVYEDSK